MIHQAGLLIFGGWPQRREEHTLAASIVCGRGGPEAPVQARWTSNVRNPSPRANLSIQIAQQMDHLNLLGQLGQSPFVSAHISELSFKAKGRLAALWAA